MVLADEEDYDPCKAGEFMYIFRLQLVVFKIATVCLWNQSIFVLMGN